jgi:hypothetical protein
MTADARRTIRLSLTEEEWRRLEALAAGDDRSLSLYVTRLVRAHLTDLQRKPPKKSKP